MPQQIDVPGMGIVEFPDNMSDDQISAAIKQNMAPAAKPQGYSFGPISDIAELGARGINAAAQALPESIRPSPREPGPMGQPVNLPFFGQPSLGGMAKSMYEGAKSGATLPGDVYAGKVDPLSDEGIKRATDLAALTQLPSVTSGAQRAATPALVAPEIEKAATTVYDTLRDKARAIPVRPDALENISNKISEVINQVGPREKNAPQAYAAIKDIAKPGSRGDLGDLLESRKQLARIAREGEGEDVAAAAMARDRLDAILDKPYPGLVNQLKAADKNYAIAMNAGKVEQKVKDAIRQAEDSGTGGNVGNKIRQAVAPMLEKGRDEYMSPQVRAAIENVTRPGMAVNALRPLAAFDPTHSKLGMYGAAIQAPGILANPLLASVPAGGYAARAMYDRILRNRAAQISEAMRAEAPATMAQQGYQPSGVIALPRLSVPSPTTGILSLNGYQ